MCYIELLLFALMNAEQLGLGG